MARNGCTLSVRAAKNQYNRNNPYYKGTKTSSISSREATLSIVRVEYAVTIDVVPSDWTELDSWWSKYSQSRSIANRLGSCRIIGHEHLTRCWEDIDPWWQTYTGLSAMAQDAATLRVSSSTHLGNYWDELDSWWETYTETGHETVNQIAELLEQANEQWANSDAPFDTDPLAAGLSLGTSNRGPPRPKSEVEWSRWLAQLLRPSGALVAELFNVSVESSPIDVVREEQLLKEDSGFRRPDILIRYPNRGISIEVKLGDENYQKTAETASLVENHYGNLHWDHVLLLPSRKVGRLESIVNPPLISVSGKPSQIAWNNPGPVKVLFWQDVTEAIRSVLRQGKAVDDHWAANAYLFCAVAEEQIMNFQPQPLIEQIANPEGVVDTLRPISLTEILGKQLMYLRETTKSCPKNS